MDRTERAALRARLRELAPWLDTDEVGPRAVDAGTCERCGQAPRLLPTCGPAVPDAVCRTCAEELGDEAWCEGHADEGRAARAWAAALPARWADVVVLWWVATGEVRPPVGAHPDTSVLRALEAGTEAAGP
jgi:hypothetical protein